MKNQKLARIEWLLEHARDRTFAFDEFGPLTIRPVGGSAWSPEGKPERLRANYHKPHGSRQFYAWYSIGADQLAGNLEPCKGSAPTLRVLQAIRHSVDDGLPIHVILDNLNHHKTRDVREWCAANGVEFAFSPTYGSWANPIEAHSGPLRQFVIANSDHRDHPALARAIRKCLRWRNTDTSDPEVLEAERRHCAKIRSEAERRWGHPKAVAAYARTFVVRALAISTEEPERRFHEEFSSTLRSLDGVGALEENLKRDLPRRVLDKVPTEYVRVALRE